MLQDQLLSDIETIKEQHTHELAELKTTLVNQHLVKFQVQAPPLNSPG